MPYMLMPGHQPGPGTELVERIDWAPGGLGCACESKGMGLFNSGLNIGGWSWPEYSVAGLGFYMVLSTIFTTRRAVRQTRRRVSRALGKHVRRSQA